MVGLEFPGLPCACDSIAASVVGREAAQLHGMSRRKRHGCMKRRARIARRRPPELLIAFGRQGRPFVRRPANSCLLAKE